jgi:hypothetical protein
MCNQGTWRLVSKNHRPVGKAMPSTSPAVASAANSNENNPMLRMVTRI